MNLKFISLKDISEVTSGGGAPQSENDFGKEGTPFIRAGTLSKLLNGQSELEQEKISEEVAKKHRLKKYSKNTILFAKSGMSATKGNIYLTAGECYVVNHLAALECNEKANPAYVAYALKKYSPTTLILDPAYPSIRLSDIANLKIPLPPLAEQKHIAVVLETADRILKLRAKAITKLDQLAESVFMDMFGDPIANSKKWKLDKLKNKATFENGDRSSNYPSGSDVIESGVLFLSTKNIVKNQLDLKHRQFISEEKFVSLTRGKAKANDLIITLRGTLGSCCIFKNDRAFINAQMMIIRAGDEFVTEFLHSLLTNASMHRHLQEIGNGAAVQQLTAGQLGDMLIPIPPLSIQVEFKNKLNAIKSEIEKNRIALNTALKLHSSLQHQSFAMN